MTTVTEPTTCRADELKVGDWLTRPGGHRPVKTLAVIPFQVKGDEQQDRIHVVFEGDSGWPSDWCMYPDSELTLATDAQIDQVMDENRRDLIAGQLEQLAELIRQPTTPLPDGWREITVDFDFGDVEEVERLAKVLGGEVVESGRLVGVVTRDGSQPRAGLVVHGHAYRRDEAPVDDPTGLLYQREADDPTPVSPGRVPLHTGAMVADGELVNDTACEAL